MRHEELNSSNFFQQLLIEVPEFTPFYQEHIQDNEGELLSYVLMGDFTRFVYSVQRKATSSSVEARRWQKVLNRSLALLERAINSPDEELESLIWLGFVENLTPYEPRDVNSYQAIKAQLGPKLYEVLTIHFDP